ncbi:hypothetical protein JCM6882_002053 [Rhodosporidiobolus microsporus]
MSSFAQLSTASSSSTEPPSTPIRTTLPLSLLPVDACPPRGRNPRKRAPPSPLDSAFQTSEQRREHLFTLSTACNRRLLSPSTPTAPLLPPAPIFMPLLPTTSSPTSTSTPVCSSAPRSSPMKRSPAMRTLCQFTADAFREDRERSLSASSSNDDAWSSTASIPSSVSPNSLGLFDFYRESSSSSAGHDSLLSSPELPGSPSSFTSSTSSGRWSDAAESDAEDADPSFIAFARRISYDHATPSPPSMRGGPIAFRTIPLPDIASLPVTARPPVTHSHLEPFEFDFQMDTSDEPSSPVPSLTFSTNSSPASSLASLSNSPSPPSSPSPSPLTSCISSFASTSFFTSSSPLSSGSSLAQRRLESLEKRRMRAASASAVPEKGFSRPEEEVFGLGLSA